VCVCVCVCMYVYVCKCVCVVVYRCRDACKEFHVDDSGILNHHFQWISGTKSFGGD
jgi:hypothetical protein